MTLLFHVNLALNLLTFLILDLGPSNKNNLVICYLEKLWMSGSVQGQVG